jgi:hypothetical protein
MGTPVGIRSREEQCKGAGKCSDPRPLTEEEMKKYYTESEVEEMSKKIEPPEKERLIEVLAVKKGRTNAIQYTAETFCVSAPVVYRWIKDYEIEFNNFGLVAGETKELIPPTEEVEHETANSILEGILELKQTEIEQPADIITITGKETTEIPQKLAFAEYDIGKSVVQVDFRAALVSINGMELPSDEAEAIADLLINIL